MKPAFRNVIIVMIILIVALPFLPLVLWSLSKQWFYPNVLPNTWGVRAWNYVFGTAGSQIITALGQSVFLATVTSLISLIISVPTGRILGLYHFRGKNLLLIVLTLPLIVPALSVAMGLHLWFLRLGLADSFVGVVLVHLTICAPYAVFVMWGVFSNYNPDFEDQARSLGASWWKVVFRVILPFTFPGIVVAGLFSFLLSWSQYLNTLIIGGGKLTTLPILLFALMGSGDRPVASAVSLVFVVPAFIALLFSARYLGRKQITEVW
jgi:putative spermidine/putrescine transport system permease protein